MKVMIVDDSTTDVLLIKNILQDYELVVASDGIEALELLEQNKDVEIMILDLNMPRMNGFEVLEVVANHPDYHRIATLILTNSDEVENEIKGLELGAMDYIRKPLNIRSLRIRIELHTKLKTASRRLEDQNLNLETIVQERTKECNLTRDITIQALLGLLEVRNVESGNHTMRTQWMMEALCKHLRIKEPYNKMLSEDYIRELINTSPLHDIGKVGIPDNILLKPGKLTPEEFDIMKKHTTYGVDALKHGGSGGMKLPFIRTACDIVGTHHERFDGNGYPNGLKGEEIPLAGRLMSIIDVYDALANARVYKPAFSHEESLKILADGRGTQFDPGVVDAFFDIEENIRKINSGKIALS